MFSARNDEPRRDADGAEQFRNWRAALDRRRGPEPEPAEGDLLQWTYNVLVLSGGKFGRRLRLNRRWIRGFQRLWSRDEWPAVVDRAAPQFRTGDGGAEAQGMMHVQNIACIGDGQEWIVKRQQHEQKANRGASKSSAGIDLRMSCSKHMSQLYNAILGRWESFERCVVGVAVALGAQNPAAKRCKKGG